MCITSLYCNLDADFNPRPREGSDHLYTAQYDNSTNFNPRPREGSDCICVSRISATLHFNPRPREGSDPRHPVS